ncbi:N-acetyltransferase domain-containing protein, partial [Aphis craccivora]
MIITSRNNAPISNYGGGSDVKVNILGALKRSKVNIFQQFSKKSRKTKKKMTEKREFLRKTKLKIQYKDWEDEYLIETAIEAPRVWNTLYNDIEIQELKSNKYDEVLKMIK